MKPYEQFVGKLLQAVDASRGKHPAAATEIIQEALRSAGLLGAATPPAPDAQAPCVDLNEPPAWARTRTAPESGPAAPSMAGAEAMRDWAARFMPHMPHMPNMPHMTNMPPRPPAGRQADAGAPGRFLSGSFSAAAGTRHYRLYVPARDASGPRALVVMLHGCQQNPEDFAAGTRMNALAEQHGCLVLYPEQSRSANGSNCWNWFEAAHQQRDQGEPSLIAGMTRDVMREHGVDPDRVFVAGLSAGGAMAAILGAAYPELYAAIGVHSGLAAGCAHDLMSGLNAMKGAGKKRRAAARHGAQRRPLPAIVFHGDQDAVVHPSNAHAVVRQCAPSSGLREVEERGQADAGRGYTRTLMLDADGRSVLEYWTVHGAGHAWAGGSGAGSYTDPSGPDASSEMLRFFLAQPRPRD